MDSVYKVREKRENKKRMKKINERLSELQELRNNFESEYNIYENQTEIPKFESVLDKLDMKKIESQIELANEMLLGMKLDPAEIEKNNKLMMEFSQSKNESESILDRIDIKKMENDIELDNQRMLKMKSTSSLELEDLGNVQLFTTEDANVITSITNAMNESNTNGNNNTNTTNNNYNNQTTTEIKTTATPSTSTISTITQL